VFAEGQLRAREREGKDGQKRTSLEIRFARVQSLERRDPGEGGGSFGDAAMDAPPAARPRAAARPAASEVEAIDVDDIPF
ncbi:MAG: single-stranded DNA-binding protein, partial [Chloroflexota bacterium]|nr:single-stranded DNA-binding protein [Chloroflexota bacterium]